MIILLRLVLVLLLAGCAAPLSLTLQDQQDAYRRLNRSALSSDRLSETTLVTLRRHDLDRAYATYPAETIAALHSQVVGQPDRWSELFALAELSFQTAEREKSRERFLAAALYAYAFLLPDNPSEAPSPYDPRFRQACDLYNLSLTAATVPSGGGEAQLQPGPHALPFGTLDLRVDEDSLSWGGRQLTGLVPTGTIEVQGLANQYQTPGLGAPMAARISALPRPVSGFQVAPRLRVPATLLLTVPSPRRQLATGHMSGLLSVYNIFDNGSVEVGRYRVPLEYDQTAARAISLAEARPWDNEISGFLSGTLLEHSNTRLVAMEPHQRGRMPVVLVHGTASSVFRWSDMVNDLLEDPRIRNNFEFWIFSYDTGNPIPYSAMLLHQSLQQAVASLGGTAADPALGHITLIGHSQGGLLVKMQVINPGVRMWDTISRKPLDQLKLQPATREMLRASLFPTPVPEVDQVIFISTPHRGSYVAGFSIAHWAQRLVTLPLAITKGATDVLTGNADALRYDQSSLRLGSVYGMSPGSPMIRALAPVPIAPGVHVHSIIPVLGNGPLEAADDGVVEYRSAHLPDAESEKVVRNSGHSTQSNPVTIEEVRRILMQQLGRICGAGDCNRTVLSAR